MNIFKFLLCILLLECNLSEQSNQKPVNPITKDSAQNLKSRYVAKSIKDLIKYTWVPNHPDTTRYLCELHFADEYAVYLFHGQCAYFFFTNTTFIKPQVIQLLWIYKTDCVLNMSFLEKSTSIKRHPKHGDVFAEYNLLNDTTLDVKYFFPEWVKMINKIAQDSLFPQRLYLENLDD